MIRRMWDFFRRSAHELQSESKSALNAAETRVFNEGSVPSGSAFVALIALAYASLSECGRKGCRLCTGMYTKNQLQVELKIPPVSKRPTSTKHPLQGCPERRAATELERIACQPAGCRRPSACCCCCCCSPRPPRPCLRRAALPATTATVG